MLSISGVSAETMMRFAVVALTPPNDTRPIRSLLTIFSLKFLEAIFAALSFSMQEEMENDAEDAVGLYTLTVQLPCSGKSVSAEYK